MAVLTGSAISTLIKDLLVINTSTDAPVGTAELLEAVNDAYKSVWEMAGGGGAKSVPSSLAWNGAVTATGTVFGILTDVREVLAMYASPNAPSAITTTTNSTTTLTSSAAFGSVVPGMYITGTGISAGTYVQSVESTSSLTMTQAASDSTSNSRTFSDTGENSGTKEMEGPVEFEYVQFLKKSNLLGTYATPKVYSLSPVQAVSPAAATTSNLLRMDYWPAVAGFYFPMRYIPQFTALAALDTTIPLVNDIFSYDIAYLAAMDLAPRIGRAELITSISLKVSQDTRLAMERKLKAMLAPDSDDAARN